MILSTDLLYRPALLVLTTIDVTTGSRTTPSIRATSSRLCTTATALAASARARTSAPTTAKATHATSSRRPTRVKLWRLSTRAIVAAVRALAQAQRRRPRFW